MDIAGVFVIISRGKRETFYLREFLKARCTSDRGKWKLFFFLHEECESCTRQRLEQRVELHTATWQLGLKRASSSSLFHSACCPTSVMLLDLPAIPLMPFELPTPFEPRFRKREAKFVEFVILARGGKGELPLSFPFGIKVFQRYGSRYDFFLNLDFLLIISLSLSLKTKKKHH